MKRITLAALVSISAFLCGCAAYTSTTYSQFDGPSELTGRGGAFRTIDGIDVWSVGEPRRKFRVLGIIDQTHNDNNSVMSTVAGMNKEGAVIAKAKEVGGDAVIYLGSNSVVTGYSTSGVGYGVAQTSANQRLSSRVAVIKYL